MVTSMFLLVNLILDGILVPMTGGWGRQSTTSDELFFIVDLVAFY